MKKLFLLFSHSLTEEQQADATQNWNVTAFVALPTDLQARFSNIPADLPALDEYLAPLRDWLLQQAQIQDLILIQGDFGAAYQLVNYAKEIALTPIYATTERQSIDTPQADGSIKTERVFRHKMFRKY